MEDFKKLAELVDRLNTLTLDNKVAWQETADESTFQAAFTKYAVTVAQLPDYEDRTSSIKIVVRDTSGRVLEAAWVSQLNSLYNSENRSLSSVLIELYENARRKALNVNNALDDLLKSLEHVDF